MSPTSYQAALLRVDFFPNSINITRLIDRAQPPGKFFFGVAELMYEIQRKPRVGTIPEAAVLYLYSKRLETGLYRITADPRLLQEVGDLTSR